MRRSLEARRLAVVAALRAVAAEPVPQPQPVPRPEPSLIDAVGARLDDLAGRLDEVLARLGSVETALLESAWEQPCPEPVVEESEPDSTVSVPAIGGLAEGRMSSVAAKALFGH